VRLSDLKITNKKQFSRRFRPGKCIAGLISDHDGHSIFANLPDQQGGFSDSFTFRDRGVGEPLALLCGSTKFAVVDIEVVERHVWITGVLSVMLPLMNPQEYSPVRSISQAGSAPTTHDIVGHVLIGCRAD